MENKQLSRRQFIRSAAAGLGALSLGNFGRMLYAADSPGKSRAKPNFVFFLVDDLGWADSSTYGSKFYETPNLDRFAKQGMLFTDAYAASPVCSPTRASIMTGKYPGRLKITRAMTTRPNAPEVPDPKVPPKAPSWAKLSQPQNGTRMALEEFTIAEALKEAGYTTGFIGKWHLGKVEKWYPDKQGFDVNIAGGRYGWPPSYFSPYKITTLEDGPEGEYITDRLTDETLKYLDGVEKKEKPFMLFLWHYGVHSPWQAKQKLIEKYKAKNPKPDAPHRNPTYAAMIHSVDESLGRVLDKLDELKLSDNTVVIFMSDNGGLMRIPGKEGRIRRGTGYREGDYITSNTPLRGGKAMIYEGGTREPLIIRWPGVVKPGSKCSEPVTSIDFYPTMLEIAGAKPKEGQILDGESIVPLLKTEGKAKLKREAIFCHYPHYIPGLVPKEGGKFEYWNTPATSVRKGDYKLIRFYEGRNELYNLAEDIGEKNNLAAKMPEKVKELDVLIDKYLEETGSLVPIPNPAYNENDTFSDYWDRTRGPKRNNNNKKN